MRKYFIIVLSIITSVIVAKNVLAKTQIISAQEQQYMFSDLTVPKPLTLNKGDFNYTKEHWTAPNTGETCNDDSCYTITFSDVYYNQHPLYLYGRVLASFGTYAPNGGAYVGTWYTAYLYTLIIKDSKTQGNLVVLYVKSLINSQEQKCFQAENNTCLTTYDTPPTSPADFAPLTLNTVESGDTLNQIGVLPYSEVMLPQAVSLDGGMRMQVFTRSDCVAGNACSVNSWVDAPPTENNVCKQPERASAFRGCQEITMPLSSLGNYQNNLPAIKGLSWQEVDNINNIDDTGKIVCNTKDFINPTLNYADIYDYKVTGSYIAMWLRAYSVAPISTNILDEQISNPNMSAIKPNIFLESNSNGISKCISYNYLLAETPVNNSSNSKVNIVQTNKKSIFKKHKK